MKIGVLSNKVTKSNDVREYFNFLEFCCSNIGNGMIIGPDYALAEKMDVSTLDDSQRIRDKLIELSRQYSGITLVPGTFPMQINDKEMVHRAFVLNNGNCTYFDKQTDCAESTIAGAHNLRYKKGRSGPNVFEFNGKKFWLHICGDRDRKPESRCNDSDVELILAHDPNAGFHIGISTPENPRYIVLSDGYHPKAEIFHYCQSPKFLKPKIRQYSQDKLLKMFKI